MQDKYVSLDPENADRLAYQQRTELFRKRVAEAKGGEAAHLFGLQVGLTTSVMYYAGLRAQGFSAFPFHVNKSHRYAGLVFAFLASSWLGGVYGRAALGNQTQLSYLYVNQSEIMRGEKSLN